MTKKNKLNNADLDLDLDDMDMDLDLDFEEVDQKSRDPISAIKKSIKSKATLDGGKGFASKVVKKSIPNSYTEAFDNTYNVRRDAEKIYYKTLKEMNPAISAMKNKIKENAATVDKVLPKRLASKLKNFADREDRNYNSEREDPIEREISNSLSDVFSSFKNKSNVDFKTSLQDKRTRQKEFLISSNLLKATATGIARIVGYQDNVLYKYHQKSLELQFRQFFATKDLIELQRVFNSSTISELKAITKNTSLPDAIKMKTNEQFHQMTKQKLIGSVQDSVSGRLKNIPQKIMKNLDTKGSEIANALNNALAGGNPMEGMDEYMSKWDIASGFGTDISEDLLSSRFGNKLKENLSKNNLISRLGWIANYGVQNFTRKLNTKAQTYDPNESMFTSFLKDMFGSENKSKDTINTNLASDATETVAWDLLSRRTLIEVIPGFLSRQLQQLTVIATGKPSERIIYDAKSEKFSTLKETVDRAKGEFNSKVSIGIKQQKDEFLKEMDNEGTLSEDAKNDLYKQVLKDSRAGLDFNPERYMQRGSLNSTNENEIREFLEKKFKIKDELDSNYNTTFKMDTKDENVRNALSKLSNQFSFLDYGIDSFDESLNKLNALGQNEIADLLGVTQHKKGKREVNDDYKENLIDQILKNGRNLGDEFETFNTKTTTEANKAQSNSFADSLNIINNDKKKKEFFKYLDPENKLSSKAKDDLFKYVLSETKDGKKFNIANLVSRGDIKSEKRDEIITFLRNKLNLNESVDYGEDFVDPGLSQNIRDFTPGNSSIVNNITGGGNIDDSSSILDAIKKQTSILQDALIEIWVSVDGSSNVKNVFGKNKKVAKGISGINETFKTQTDTTNDLLTQILNAIRAKDFNNDLSDQDLNDNEEHSDIIGDSKTKVKDFLTLQQRRSRILKRKLSRKGKQTLEDFNKSKYGKGYRETKDWTNAIIGGTAEFTKNNSKQLKDATMERFNSINDKKGNSVSDFRKGITESYVDDKGQTRYRINRDKISNGELKTIKAGYKIATVTKTKANRHKRNLGSGINKLRDLYVRGKEFEPAISAEKILNGEYFDAISGKQIIDWSDIKGEIKDKDGNVKVSVKDFMRGFVDAKGKPVVNPFKSAYAKMQSKFGLKFDPKEDVIKEDLNKTKQRVNWTLGGKGHRLENIKRIGGEIKEATKEISKDIFSADDLSKPKLYTEKVKKGLYVDYLTGKVIKCYTDITGPVIETETETTVLSVDDITNGLVDNQNKPIPGILSRIKDLFQFGKDIKLSPIFKNGKFELPNSGTLKGMKGHGNILGRIYHSIIAFPDVYTKNDRMNPKILGRDIPSGKYTDVKSGEIIFSIKDINGPIAETESGNLIITADNIKEGLYDKYGHKLDGLFAKAYRFLAPLYSAQFKMIGFGFKMAWKVATAPIKLYKMLTKTQCDVYVKGDLTNPRLHKLKLKRGHYFDITSNKVIRYIEDIKGPIKDLTNNGDIVLSEEDFKTGIVDGLGKKLRPGFFGKIGRALMTPFKIIGATNRFALDLVKGGLKLTGRLIGGIGKIGGAKSGAGRYKGIGITGNSPEDRQSIIALEGIKTQHETTARIVNAINDLNPNKNVKYWEKGKKLKDTVKEIGGKTKEKGKGVLSSAKEGLEKAGSVLDTLMNNKAAMAALGVGGAALGGWLAGKALWNNASDGIKETISDIAGSTVDKWKAKFGNKEAQDRLDTNANTRDGTIDKIATPTKVPKNQKAMMRSVYNAYVKAGLSPQQARVITAQVGRENDYNPDVIFGYHNDPATGHNIGMLSWQGSRNSQLKQRLAAKGLLTGNGMVHSQESIDEMAKFSVDEMKGPYRNKLGQYLDNPNISWDEASRLTGKNYVVWAYGQDSIKTKNGKVPFPWKVHHAKEKRFYDAMSEFTGGSSTTSQNKASASPTITGVDNAVTSDKPKSSFGQAAANDSWKPLVIKKNDKGELETKPFEKTQPGSNKSFNISYGKVSSGANAQGIDKLNAALISGTQDAISRGVKYNYGSKDSSRGSIDCSGWIMENNHKAITQNADLSGCHPALSAMKQGAANEGAAGIIRQIGQLTGQELSGSNVNINTIKEGMLIGIDHSQGGAKSGAGRYKGIDHIVQVVKDPTTGRLLISESSSHKGVHFTDAAQWLQRMSKKPLYAVDPYAPVRGGSSSTGNANAGNSLPISSADTGITSDKPKGSTSSSNSESFGLDNGKTITPNAVPVSPNFNQTGSKSQGNIVFGTNQPNTREPEFGSKTKSSDLTKHDEIAIKQREITNSKLDQLINSVNNVVKALAGNTTGKQVGGTATVNDNGKATITSNKPNGNMQDLTNQNQPKQAVNSVINTSRQRAAGN